MDIKKLATVAVLVLSTASCAGGYAGHMYEPVIDQFGSPGKNPAAYAGDLNQCQVMASARPQASDAIKGAGVGGAIGAAGGALTGLVRGKNEGAATLYGLAAGTLVGGGMSLYQSNQNRQNIIMNCMESKGWVVIGR